jgi:hypothetical protein
VIARRVLAAAMAMSLVAPAAALADGSAGSAASTAQFDKGRALMKQKKYPEACEAFAQSQKLDPQNGTLFNLATCQMHIGKLASAWVAFRELAAKDTNAARKAESGKLAASLEPRLPRLTITIPLQEPPQGLAVTVDGADVTAVVGSGNPIDIGDHEIVATATGYQQATKTVTVSEEAQTVEITLPMTKSPEPPPSTVPATVVTHTPPPEPAGPPPKLHRHLVGGIVGAGGLVVVGVGLFFGKLAKDKLDDAKQACGDDLQCTSADAYSRGHGDISSAKTRGYVSDAAVVGGAALLGVGIWLLVTHSHAEHREEAAWMIAPTASPSGGGLSFSGSF